MRKICQLKCKVNIGKVKKKQKNNLKVKKKQMKEINLQIKVKRIQMKKIIMYFLKTMI